VLAALVWAVPLIGAGIEAGLEQLAIWVGRLAAAR
jgi:hypothetical protein